MISRRSFLGGALAGLVAAVLPKGKAIAAAVRHPVKWARRRTCRWTGMYGLDWNDARNWTPRIPLDGDDVIVGRSPICIAPQACKTRIRNLTILPGANFGMPSDGPSVECLNMIGGTFNYAA